MNFGILIVNVVDRNFFISFSSLMTFSLCCGRNKIQQQTTLLVQMKNLLHEDIDVLTHITYI